MHIQNSFLSFAFIIILLTGFLPLGNLLPSAYAISATGGTITYSGGKTIHTFTSSGTFTVSEGGLVQYLVVSGGGDGGNGGGGAGGVLTGYTDVTAQAYAITIGAGGDNSNGGVSTFSTFSPAGGGRGGTVGGSANGSTGGSGGGAGGCGDNSPLGTGGAGTGGQGFVGGDASWVSPAGSCGGGGGASQVGENGIGNSDAGKGGNGIANPITGSTIGQLFSGVYYVAGGGGGGDWQPIGDGGAGGLGGGGQGQSRESPTDTSGQANTGSGGGGYWGGSNAPGVFGGSGVVIISYNPNPPAPDRIINLSNSTTPTDTTIDLNWTAPSAGGGNQYIIGYQLNVTTPQTINPLIFVNDTGTTATNYNVTGLTSSTEYSARVSAWTNNTDGHPFNNATGNVFNFTTSTTNDSIFLDDLDDVVLTTPSQFSILFYNGIHWLDQIFKSNSLTCTAGLFFSGYNNQTGDYTCGAPTSPALNTQTPQNDFQITGINNATGVITTNQFSINTKTCSGTDKISGIDNSTGDVICSTDTSGTARESLVAVWTVDSTKSNIGASYVNVYTTGLGDPIRIDTNGMSTATLSIDWTKVGTGTQKCRIVSSTNNAIVLITLANVSSGLNTNATQDIPTNAENRIDTFKPQCFSTIANDDPIWRSGVVLLR